MSTVPQDEEALLDLLARSFKAVEPLHVSYDEESKTIVFSMESSGWGNDGYMTSYDKTKLDSIEFGAEVNQTKE